MLKNLSMSTRNYASTLALSAILAGAVITPTFGMETDPTDQQTQKKYPTVKMDQFDIISYGDAAVIDNYKPAVSLMPSKVDDSTNTVSYNLFEEGFFKNINCECHSCIDSSKDHLLEGKYKFDTKPLPSEPLNNDIYHGIHQLDGEDLFYSTIEFIAAKNEMHHGLNTTVVLENLDESSYLKNYAVIDADGQGKWKDYYFHIMHKNQYPKVDFVLYVDLQSPYAIENNVSLCGMKK